MAERTCACGSSIHRYNKSGLCRPCNLRAINNDPEKNAKRLEAMRAVFAGPELRAKRSQANRERYKDPSARAKTGASVAAQLANCPVAKARHKAASTASLRKWHEKARETGYDYSGHTRKHWERFWAWCPPERRDEYASLRQSHGAAEAKRLILDDLARIESRRLAAMTPHERNLERIRNGAGITEKPVLRQADHAFTIGGVASYE